MKTIEKPIQPGQWKISLKDHIAGHEIVSVALKGLRNHPQYLRAASPAEYFERHPKDVDAPMDTPPAMRATPTMFLNLGQMIYLWPNPSHG